MYLKIINIPYRHKLTQLITYTTYLNLYNC